MKAPDIRTSLPGPKAAALVERDSRSVSPSSTRSYPFVMARGEGATVEDADGNVFLDGAAGVAVCSTGHCHPDIVRVVKEQAGRYLHISGADFYDERQIVLAEEIARIAPIEGGVRSFFSNSGTEAMEAAVKVARYHSRRFNLIGFLGGFHGRSLGSLGLTAGRSVQRRGFGPMMPGVYHAPYADCYRCPLHLRAETCEAECLSFIEDEILVHLCSPDEVAAVVVEPIQGEGGYRVPPAQFIQRLRALTNRHGILLVDDEVQSGMGRTGRMFAIEHYGVRADIVVIAKGVASGMPLGITAARSEVMSWPPGAHASTFGGNPVSCAAALETIRLLDEGLIANAAEVGGFLFDGVKSLADGHSLIGDVRGKGLMIGVELVRDRRTKERARLERDLLVQAAFARGLLLLGAGLNTVRLCPPLVLSRQQAETIVRILDESLTAVEQGGARGP